MKAIVFSRDRPMQLDLLLTSLEQNAPGLFDVTVIWFADREKFLEGYAICAEEHPGVCFLFEDGLTYQVRHLLRDGGLMTFFTDDDVLYRRLNFIPRPLPNVICFSLRLGRNTTHCYPHGRSQSVPEQFVWRWDEADGDFGYPMSLDGHVFRADDLLPLIGNFSTPNWLEVMLMQSASEISRPFMSSFEHSHLLGVPLNRVQSDMPNRNGDTHPYSIQELNDRYLSGERIDLDALDFSDIRGAHQEIPLVFR